MQNCKCYKFLRKSLIFSLFFTTQTRLHLSVETVQKHFDFLSRTWTTSHGFTSHGFNLTSWTVSLMLLLSPCTPKGNYHSFQHRYLLLTVNHTKGFKNFYCFRFISFSIPCNSVCFSFSGRGQSSQILAKGGPCIVFPLWPAHGSVFWIMFQTLNWVLKNQSTLHDIHAYLEVLMQSAFPFLVSIRRSGTRYKELSWP